MRTSDKPETWWSKRGFGCASLGVSLVETLITYGAAVLVQISKQPEASSLILSIVSTAFLIGGLGSFGFAIAGLFADSQRLTAFIALFVAVITFVVCGLQNLV